MPKNLKSILVIIISLTLTANAQLESKVGFVADFKINTWYDISIDSQVLHQLSENVLPKDVSFQFAIPVTVNLTPENSGVIYELGNENIWIVAIRSKAARSINLILEPFVIPAGAYIYIYDKSKQIIRGAFTDKNNSRSKLLPVMPVPGEEIILEYHIPKGVAWENTLGISQVAHDYLGIFGADGKKDNRYNQSQPCNVDINCAAGVAYSDERRAVCRLIVNGTELCTGVLLNNTNQQNRPLLITAQHCIVNQNDASKTLIVFGYESPWCNGPDGSVSHSISGSELKATNQGIDFSLVELSSFPPLVYKPYLAGWDISGVVPESAVTIHHPQGDVKKISIDNDPPVTATFSNYVSKGFWQIIQWDFGTTEGGSSGCPLFDQNKRVVGILTGGEAVCGRSVNDYFAKLSIIYDLSSLLYEQLKGWIDPALTGVKQLNGRDPYAANRITADTLSNITKTEKVTFTRYPLPRTGFSTGFNSDSLIMYAEYFKNPPGREIVEVWLNMAKTGFVSATDTVRVYVFAGGQVPGQILATQKIRINEAKDSFLLKLDFNQTVPVSSDFYVGWRIWYKEKANSETRQFAVYHSPDRGISALNTSWFNEGSGWKQFTQHPFAPMSASLDVKVVTVGNSIVDKIRESVFNGPGFLIYPNPAKNFIAVSSEKDIHLVKISLTDMLGTSLRTEIFNGRFPGEILMDLSGLKPGIYFVNIISVGSTESHKILINR